MKRIAVFGTHGAAKTTLIYKLAAFYKMNDKNVTVIHETVRQSPFPINTNVIYQTTLYAVTTQIKKELEAEAQGFEIAISDRTPSDAFIYINHVKRDNVFTRSLEEFCLEWVQKYDLLIYLEPTPGFMITADGIRASGVDYQNAIRDDFRELVRKIEQKYQGTVNILKAESNQIFDENEFRLLANDVNNLLYAEKKDLLVESGSTI